MPGREFASEAEFVAGRKADGSKPTYHSRKFYGGPTKLFTTDQPAVPPVADEQRTPDELDADRMRYEVELRRKRDLDMVAEYGREMMRIGFGRMKGIPTAGACDAGVPPARVAAVPAAEPAGVPPAGTEEQAPPEARVDVSMTPTPEQAEALERLGLEVPRVPNKPYSGSLRGDYEIREARPESSVPAAETAAGDAGGTPATRAAGLPDVALAKSGTTTPRPTHADKPLSLSQSIAMGERGAKLVFSVSNALAECDYRLIDMASKTDARKRFMEDRAVAIVYQTLLHLDDQFSELGFGAWMPFRWPDQWLSFTGIMTRVLAANGLVYAKHADVYRKLLDETPMVDFKGTVQDRVKESRTPNNIARCKSNQGAYTMSELKTRLQKEVWGPADESERRYEEYWRQQMSRKTPP